MDQMTINHLPKLKKGINLLKTGGYTETIQALVINNLIISEEEALWIDTGNQCSTYMMSHLTPADDILENIKVARAFTPYQHHELVRNLSKAISSDTNLLVLPLLDHLYHKKISDEKERSKMLRDMVSYIKEITIKEELTTVITAEKTLLISDVVDQEIECKRTRHGIMFSTDCFTTISYTGPGYIQTTLKLWEILLERLYREKTHSKTVLKKEKEVIKAG